MKSTNFSIYKKNRKILTNSHKNYRIFYGFGILLFGLLITIVKGFPISTGLSFLGIGIIVIGLISVFYGIIGVKIFAQKIQIECDKESFQIKKSFTKNTIIKFDTISFMKFLPKGIEISFSDYSKNYDLSLLSIEEFEALKEILIEHCDANNIEFAQ